MVTESITVTPMTISAGEGITVAGADFAAQESVTIVLMLTATAKYDLATATANSSGSFSADVSAATLENLAPGAYTVKATGSEGAMATAPLVIQE